MRPDEAKRLLKQLAGLFSGQVTQDQASYILSELAPLDCRNCERAIREHRTFNERINFPELWVACKATLSQATNQAAESPKKTKDLTWADSFRRQRPDLASSSDAELILIIHRGWWNRCNQSDAYRTKFGSSCRAALIESGKSHEEAAGMAQVIFADGNLFALTLQDLRGELPVGGVA